jgi:CelD/BcsL family acetyltransferase involved in cellulose biosynthesis
MLLDYEAYPGELDPLGDPRWGEFVGRHPRASIFHHPAWLGLLQRQYGFAFTVWSVADASGALVAGLPLARIDSRLTGKRLVAVPFSDACSPLVLPGARGAPEVLAKHIADAQTAARLPLLIRGPVEGVRGARLKGQFLHHRLQLGRSVEASLAGAGSAAVRGVAKAQREGVVIERARDRGSLEEFYALHLRTRRRQGVPTQPKRFVLALAELFERELGFVLIARHHEAPIAAAVFLAFNGTLVYKYGASDERTLGVRPNNLLFHEAIRWGAEHGFHELDFGRTDLDNPGLAAFKRGWGCTEEMLVYSYLGMEPPRAPRRGEHVLRAVIRRTPLWTGRLLGELLYRHTA